MVVLEHIAKFLKNGCFQWINTIRMRLGSQLLNSVLHIVVGIQVWAVGRSHGFVQNMSMIYPAVSEQYYWWGISSGLILIFAILIILCHTVNCWFWIFAEVNYLFIRAFSVNSRKNACPLHPLFGKTQSF